MPDTNKADIESENSTACVHREAVTAEDILPPQNIETAAPVTADELAEGLAQAMPEPTDSKQIQQDAAPANPASDANAFEQDPKGRKFDPELHAVDDNGKPRRNVRGYFVSKKIGRPSGKASPRSVIADAPSGEMVGENEGGPDRFAMTAETYFALGINIAASFLSSEVLPESDEQKRLITVPLADVLRKHSVNEMEPEARLLIGCGVYGFAKYQKPTVKERVLKLFGRKPKTAAPEGEPAAP